MYAAWLFYGDHFKDIFFPDLDSWTSQIVITQEESGWNSDSIFQVRELDGRVFLAPSAHFFWKQDKSTIERVISLEEHNIFSSADGELTIILKKMDAERLCFNKYLVASKTLTVGRNPQNNVYDADQRLSTAHGYIAFGDGKQAEYTDNNSANGTYLNGRRIMGSTVVIQYGDVLTFPSGLKIVFLGNMVAINRLETLQHIQMQRAVPRANIPMPHTPEHFPSLYVQYHRAPRMLQKPVSDSIEIEPPLAKQNNANPPLWQQVGPSMTMVLPMLMGTLIAGSRGSGMVSSGLIMVGTSSMLAVMWGLINRRYRQQQAEATESQRIGLYQKYIAEMEQTLRDMNTQEYNRLVTTYPNVGECVALPTDGTYRLWNRMPTHPDFLNIRLGLGRVPLPSAIETQKQKLSIINDPLRDEPERLKQTYATIDDAPVLAALRGESVVGILGREEATQFAQGLLMQIAALHSYHDVRIVVFTEETNTSQWAWARWLPHVFASEDRQMRMVVSNPSAVHDVMNHLNDVMNMRRTTQEDGALNAAESDEDRIAALPLPHYIVFCTDNRMLENEPTMRQLLTNQLGMTLIMLAPSMELLPKECHLILNVAAKPGQLHTSDGETTQIDFEYPNRNLLLSFARQLAPLRVKDAAENAAIPTLVSFLDIYGVRRTDDLDVWRMWTENHTYNGLRSVIGYAAGSQPFVLDISDKYHGPHGLIAGTTGSGKSVMLQTYILSLALNYSPAEIQFILIDYKGGGMADAFRGLPHVAGIIDNLQGELIISRALASLNGEIHRREHIFKEHGVDKIDEYNRVFGSDPSEPTLPHLIIIVDEFAELKSEQPEFMSELVSASRVGRSLGVHLILATQKPSNSVSDEIWANSRFHLCLRVQTRSDSMEMLKRPDAAFIKGMGRCFIQIGNDELFEQVQTSYSGLTYNPNEPRAEEMPHLLGNSGQAVRTPKPKKAKSANPKEKETTQMDAVLARISEIAGQHSLDHQRQLWLPPMPNQLYFSQMRLYSDTVVRGTRYANSPEQISFLMGMADDVAQQRYLPYVVNLTQVRNLMIVGLAGTGKTTAIQSIVTSLVGQYDPEHVNIYIMSLTSKTLNSLAAFPHVGDIVFESDIIEIKRLINMLFEEEERRSEMFAELSTDSFIEYNRACRSKGRPTVPAIVVFIDRYEQLKTIFANDDFYTARIQALLREGSGRGIHFIVTALGKNEIQAKLHPFFSGIALQLRERADYSDVIGTRLPFDMAPIANVPGRGMGIIMEGDKAVPYEIQFALGGYDPGEPSGEDFADLNASVAYSMTSRLDDIAPLPDGERNERIAAFANQLNAQWQGRRPAPIPRIPENPDYPQFTQAQGFADMQITPYQLPVGYDMTKGSLACMDLEKNFSMLVTGPKKSGRTNFLKLLARLFSERGADVFVYGDPSWKKLTDSLGAHLYTTEDELSNFINMFVSEYPAKRKALHDAALAQGRAQARKQALEFKPCAVLLDDVERICRDFTAPRFSKSADQIIAEYEQALKAAREAGTPEPQEPSEEIRKIAAHPVRHNIPTKKFIADLLAQMSTIAELYNIFIFMSVSSANRLFEREEPIKSLIAQGRGVALGGRLSDFDPLGISASLQPQTRSQALPAGAGYLVTNAGIVSIRVPLADTEEE